MSEKNEGMPFVPEEDLDLHQNFQPIIAENGLIRPKKLPEDLTVSPDTTFTRMDTVQDLVQIRSAEEKAKEEAKKQEAAPQAAPAPQPESNANSVAHVQTVEAGAFAPEVPPEKSATPQEPAVPEQPAKPQAPAQPQEDSQSMPSSLLSRDLPPDLPTIPFAQPISKKRKSKKERRKLKAALKEKKTLTQTLAQQPVALLPAPKKRRRWLWLVAILCLLFLGMIGGVVPVENIPLLRNIAYAMGFSKNDTSRMSFLRALLTWADKGMKSPGQNQQGTDGQASSGHLMALERLRMQRSAPINEEEDLGSLSSRMQREGGKTSLIDIQALNALQRQKGRRLDSIRGASMYFDQGKEPEAAALRDDDVNVRTEANKDNGEVFFGSDAFNTNRDAKDGFDSVNEFKKIANPNIAGVNSVDWFTMTAQRMMKTDMGLGGVNKEFTSTHLNWGNNLNTVGKDKEHRDLYSAWISSRMSKYTSNLMVKKALADTGFMGAEVPTMASNAVGMGGILLDTDSLQEDREAWQEYLDFKKQCEAALGKYSKKIDDAVNDFNAIVKKAKEDITSLGYPANCYEALPMTKLPETFTNNTVTIQRVCKDLDIGYKNLRDACDMTISSSDIACDSLSDNYGTSFEKFHEGCNAYYIQKEQEYLTQQEAEWKKTHTANQPFPREEYAKKYKIEQWPTDGKIDEFSFEGKIYGGSEVMFAQIRNDGSNFTTWIKANCETDGNGNVINCTPVDYVEATGKSDQIEGVKETIGGYLLQI